MPVVVRNTPRTDRDLVAALGECGVAAVHESQGRTGLLDPRLRPLYPGATLAGTALTCTVAPGDNWTLHVAVEQARDGDVLVVTPTSPCTDGYLGDLLAASLRAHGVRGVVIDAGVRDAAALTEMRFPVWSAAVCAQGTVKRTPGDCQVPIVAAGVPVRPGDVVVADADGVVCVSRARAGAVLTAARERLAAEEATRERLAAGELGLDLYGMRAGLAAAGLRYVEWDGGAGDDGVGFPT